jgi:hypothetical protein
VARWGVSARKVWGIGGWCRTTTHSRHVGSYGGRGHRPYVRAGVPLRV